MLDSIIRLEPGCTQTPEQLTSAIRRAKFAKITSRAMAALTDRAAIIGEVGVHILLTGRARDGPNLVLDPFAAHSGGPCLVASPPNRCATRA